MILTVTEALTFVYIQSCHAHLLLDWLSLLVQPVRSDKITNEEVLGRAGTQRKVIHTVKSHKLCYFGHIIRHGLLNRVLLEGQLEGRRSRGRPTTTWTVNIYEWTGLTYNEAVRKTETGNEPPPWRGVWGSSPRKF